MLDWIEYTLPSEVVWQGLGWGVGVKNNKYLAVSGVRSSSSF